MRQSIIFLTLFTLLIGCQQSNTSITNSEDYNVYLQEKENPLVKKVLEEEKFWLKKLQISPEQYPYYSKLAGLHSTMFSQTGQIDYLIKVEEDLKIVLEKSGEKNAGTLHALAKNYISQHRFKEALELLKKAEILGQNLKGTQKMLFDVYLELGDVATAESYLNKFKNFENFDYLIRLSKWCDHKGDLDQAISHLANSMRLAEASNDKSLMQWAYTNIADYYGHAGKIKKSYNYYLKSLALDPNDTYALKGIAWIVYAHERNPNESSRIINSISKQNQSPEYYLLKAEIAEFQNDNDKKEDNLEKYWTSMKNKPYGDMYNKYNLNLILDENKGTAKAFEIALKEINNRPTAQSYDLLAWTYFNTKNYKKALEIAEQHVINKTHEPEILYHVAEILKANNKMESIVDIKAELIGSIYELGPLMEKRIYNL